MLVLHGARDSVVAIALGREVYDAANDPREFYVIAGAGHNDTYVVGGSAYFMELRRWTESLE